MPIARLIEYKIALPSEHAFDLLMNIGNAGYFMPITRPGVIPRLGCRVSTPRRLGGLRTYPEN